jgi:hypothetical protein
MICYNNIAQKIRYICYNQINILKSLTVNLTQDNRTHLINHNISITYTSVMLPEVHNFY